MHLNDADTKYPLTHAIDNPTNNIQNIGLNGKNVYSSKGIYETATVKTVNASSA
tara:strand:+ start:1613 stop:1774 length:162 start_codon:yes stop_codon:yes gene_type:complete